MISLDCAVIVEGKYDKIRLSNIVDAPIFTTDGFRIFKDKEKIALLRAVAQKNGIIILSDSDSAGQFIRNRLKNLLAGADIKNIYLPPLAGKERRKKHASSEGILGVEGTADEIIIKALSDYISEKPQKQTKKIQKSDFLEWGLSGDGSKALREALKQKLGLPKAVSTNGLLEIANLLYGYDEFYKIVNEVK